MNIAIMGAGLSGLACAITLEKHGVKPFIFEKRRTVGDRFVNGEALFHILDKPINNSLTYFSTEFGINLSPISEVHNLFVYSENNKAEIKSNSGYTNIRGRHENSFENQLASQVKSEIIYNSEFTYEQLVKDYDYTVIATGDASYALNAGNYRTDLTVTLKGATVEGSFSVESPGAWLNYTFAPKGYGFLIPFSEREATLVIAYPDYPENKVKDAHEFFELFYRQACKDLNQDLRITDNFEVTGYIIGISSKAKIENTFFVGNNFGSIMPSFGFGQFMAILTGVYSAWDILGMGKYDELTQPLRNSYENSLVLRRALEKMDNKKLDLLVKSINNSIMDKVFDNKGHFDFLKLLAHLLKPFVY